MTSVKGRDLQQKLAAGNLCTSVIPAAQISTLRLHTRWKTMGGQSPRKAKHTRCYTVNNFS